MHMLIWLLARCQQAIWAYQEHDEGGPIPTMGDAFFALLALAGMGPVLR